MGARRLLFVSAVAALLVFPGAALAQVSSSGQVPDIGFGFGPLSVVPASVGTPVYAAGDAMWVQSYLSSTGLYINLMAPNGTATPLRYLQPGTLELLYTFKGADPPGKWTVTTFTAPSTTLSSVEVTLAPPTARLAPQFVGASVSQNLLLLNYSLPPTDSYDVQGCTMGSSPSPEALFQLPGSIGGSMDVALNGSSASVILSQARSAFSGWFELYTQRSYLEGEALVSQEALAAQSGVFSGSPAFKGFETGLPGELFLRQGRYDLRAYIRGPLGLTVFDAPFLKLDGSGWVSLAGCTQLSDVAAPAFTMTTNLDNANTTWPRQVYTLYDQGGVEGYSVSTVPVGEARIDLRSASQVARIPGVTVTAVGGGVESWDSYASGVYVVGTNFPFSVSLQVDFGGITRQTYSVTIPAPFSTQILSLQVGTLSVQANSGGKTAANATIMVSPYGGEGSSFGGGPLGAGSFTLPPGEYNVTAVYEGRTASTTTQVGAGGTATVSLDLAPQSSLYAVIALAAVLAAGAGANLFVWREYLERRKTLGRR